MKIIQEGNLRICVPSKEGNCLVNKEEYEAGVENLYHFFKAYLPASIQTIEDCEKYFVETSIPSYLQEEIKLEENITK